MAEKMTQAGLNDDSLRPNYKRLTDAEKQSIIEAMNNGATRAAVAARFDVTPATISNTMFKYREDQAAKIASSANLPVKEEVAPEPKLDKLVESNDIGVFFDGEHLVIRIPKAKITRELLKSVL